MKLSNRNINWLGYHHELELLALKQYLFVENTGSRTLKVSDFPRIKKDFQILLSHQNFKKLNQE